MRAFACHRLTELLSATAALLLGIGITLSTPATLSGQRLAVGDPDEGYLRALQLLGRAPTRNSFLIRPLSMREGFGSAPNTTTHPWFGRWGASFHAAGSETVFVHDPQGRTIFNSTLPESRNEGALTPGRYLTMAFDGGASVRAGPLTVSLRPMVAWVQNGEFDLGEARIAGQPEYAYPWKRIDAPQRFGPEAFWQIDPGQSEVRLDYGAVSASAGTTNLWWGPGVRNAILMSDNAAGFPHLALETARPLQTRVGTFEGQWIFGRLQQSDWFDDSIPDVGRYVSGAAFSFSPSFWGLDDLNLGAARIFYARVPEGGIPAGEYFLVFQTPIKENIKDTDNPGGNDERDQLFSLFARWVLPESGFEVYTEWSRNDHNDTLVDYFLFLGSTQAFTLGLQKATELSSGTLLVFSGELTQLENVTDRRVTSQRGPYYAHSKIPRGYTQKGQIIGASIGPGGNAQYLGATLYAPWGGWSAWVQRRVYDKDAWYSVSLASGGARAPDAQLSLGGSATVFRGGWDIQASLDLSRRINRFYQTYNDASNLRFGIDARWRVGWSGRGRNDQGASARRWGG